MWLFSTEATFEAHRLTPQQDEKRYNNTARVWTPPTSFFKAQAASQFGRTCSVCWSKRKADISGKALLADLPLLYCSRCQTKHTTIHFSKAQRQLQETCGRVCIGHEGFFYLCDHIVPLTWHQLISMGHDRETPLEPDEMTENRSCLDRKHFIEDSLCKVVECSQGTPPSYCVGRDEYNKFFMEVWAQQHLAVKRLPSGKICASSLRTALEKEPLDMQMKPWMPTSWPVAGNPLRAFDPNICDCVEWYGASQSAEYVRWPTCPEPARPRRHQVQSDSIASMGPRCRQYDHRSIVMHTGAEGIIRFEPCQDRDDLLVLYQRARYYIGDACGSGWQSIVYGPSYGETDDEDMRGITWCPHSTCAVSSLLQRDMYIRSVETRQQSPDRPRKYL